MARDSPRKDYQVCRGALDESDEVSERDRQFITDFLDAYDKNELTVPVPEGESAKAYSTLKNKASILKQYAERMDDIADADADDVNSYLTLLKSGEHPEMQDGGYSPNTVRNHAGAMRLLYDYHDQIEKDKIAMPAGEKTSVDEQDMFTEDEIQDLRDACPNARDRCILELLIFTGQRVRAIQTLRLKDLYLDEGRFRLNPTVDGLKGAEGKRPLLGAIGPIRRWLQHHPASDDSEAHLITCLPNSSKGTPGEQLHSAQIQRRMQIVAEEAGVDKPTNPHQYRHYFVTVAKRDYDLDDSQVKHLIGHRPDSNVMQTTYSHLTDEEIAENVAVQAGFEERSEESSPLSPPTCPTCDEPLADTARACSVCGTTFTPDAKSVEEDMEDQLYEGRADDDGDHGETIDALRDAIRENPEFKEALLDELMNGEE